MHQKHVYPFAAPSFVIPAGVAENATFLAHKVEEVGLCFFEAKACLAYTEEDLPLDLRALPLRWHVHLPVDLVWSRRYGGGTHAAKMALAVFEKSIFLRPRYAVLHPPVFEENLQEQERLLHEFKTAWYAKTSVPVLLENIQDAPLYDLDTSLFYASKAASQKEQKTQRDDFFGVCLDVGHMLAFSQEEMLSRKDLLQKVQLVHWSAPGEHDQHLPLTQFTEEQKTIVKQLAPLLPRRATHMIEVFKWQGVQESVKFLQNTLE